MTDDQFVCLMAGLGFGFGSLFWTVLMFFIFGWSARQ